MLRKKFLSLNFFLWLFFYIAIFFYALNISFSYIDTDLPWHLRIGQQIIAEKSVPTIDYYNYTLANRSLVDHEWLFNLLFYYLYDTFGYLSLNIFFALLLTITFVVLKYFTQIFFINKYLSKKKQSNLANLSSDRSMFFIMILQFCALFALRPLVGVRMQIAGNLLFLTLLLILESFNKNKQKKYLFILPFLFMFWANLHGSFLIGLIIMWSWFAYKIAEQLLRKYKFFKKIEFNLLNKQAIFFSFLIFITATVSTLINPYGIKLYSFLSDYTNSFYMSTIAEWLPFYYLPILYKQLIFSAIFLAIFILSVYFFNKKNSSNDGIKKYISKLNLWSFLLAFLFFILSLKSKRHFPLFFITSFSLIVQFLYFEFTVDFKKSFSKKTSLSTKIFVIILFSAISLYFLTNTKITSDPFAYKINSNQPYRIVSFLKNNSELRTKKIFNPYSWGGYFLWTMPETKIFIDGRMPQLPYNEHSLLEEYKDFFNKQKLEQKLLDYKIDLVVIQKNYPVKFNKLEKSFLGLNEKKINDETNVLQEFLKNSSSWNKIYEDSLGEIYLHT